LTCSQPKQRSRQIVFKGWTARFIGASSSSLAKIFDPAKNFSLRKLFGRDFSQITIMLLNEYKSVAYRPFTEKYWRPLSLTRRFKIPASPDETHFLTYDHSTASM
jgi:hypothetical protein